MVSHKPVALTLFCIGRNKSIPLAHLEIVIIFMPHGSSFSLGYFLLRNLKYLLRRTADLTCDSGRHVLLHRFGATAREKIEVFMVRNLPSQITENVISGKRRYVNSRPNTRIVNIRSSPLHDLRNLFTLFTLLRALPRLLTEAPYPGNSLHPVISVIPLRFSLAPQLRHCTSRERSPPPTSDRALNRSFFDRHCF